MSIESHLLALREDRTTFAQFYTQTRAFWFGTAHKLVARHRAPGVSAEDVVQEMMLELSTGDLLESWQGPERHGSLHLYVVRWGVVKLAARYLRVMCGALHDGERGTGAEPTPVSWIGDADNDVDIIARMTPAVQFTIDAWLDAPKHATTDRERDVLNALCDNPDMDDAAARLGITRGNIRRHAREIGRRACA